MPRGEKDAMAGSQQGTAAHGGFLYCKNTLPFHLSPSLSNVQRRLVSNFMFGVSMALAEAWEPGKTIPVQASYGFPEKCPDSLKPDSATESGCSKTRVKWSYMTTKHSKKKER